MICAQVVGATGQAQAADRFVSTAGSDTANDCLTGASPCRTVAHGLARGEWGHTEGAGGRFRENPTVTDPTTLTLSGGWAEGFSVRDPDLMRTALWAADRTLPVMSVVAAGGYRVAVVTGTLSRRRARPHQHGRSERPAVAVVTEGRRDGRSRSGRIPPLWGLFSRSLCRMPTSSCRLAISGPQRRPKLS